MLQIQDKSNPRNSNKKEVKKIDITNFFFIMLLVEVTTIYKGSNHWQMLPSSVVDCPGVSQGFSRYFYQYFFNKTVEKLTLPPFSFLVVVTTVCEGSNQQQMSAQDCHRLFRSVLRISKVFHQQEVKKLSLPTFFLSSFQQRSLLFMKS